MSKNKTKTAAPKTKPLTLPTLLENFDEWELALKHLFYAAGWIKMYEASFDADPDPEATAEDRQIAWGVITQSLPMDRLKRVDSVTLGQVEDLIKEIRQQFYRETAGTKNNLKGKMLNAQLENHDCFESYASALQLIFVRLGKLGCEVNDEDRAFYLLRGLPSDYDMVKSNLELPRPDPLSWAQHMHALREFIASHPGIVGGASKHKSENAFSTNDQASPKPQPSQQVCRDHAKGQCTRGSKCRYKHVQAPLKCSYCNKPNHSEKECYSKRRDQAAAAEETKATREDPDPHEFTCAVSDTDGNNNNTNLGGDYFEDPPSNNNSNVLIQDPPQNCHGTLRFHNDTCYSRLNGWYRLDPNSHSDDDDDMPSLCSDSDDDSDDSDDDDSNKELEQR